MAIFLVRHAQAGKRSEWNGDDEARPLSDRGRSQSAAIRELLLDQDVRKVVSSPYLRCVQTVEPVAERLGLAVEPDDRLGEGADLDAALELLLSLDADDGVACSHGDLVPLLLDQLVGLGMAADGPLLHQKGSVWTIETDGGRPVRATYTPPGA